MKPESPSIVVTVRDMDQEPAPDGFHMLATVGTMREAAAAVMGYALGLGDRSPAAGFDMTALAEGLEAYAIGTYWRWIVSPTPAANGRDTRLVVKLETRKGS